VADSRYTAGDVVPLAEEHTDALVRVLSEAFYDYPVMRYVLGPEGDYDSRLLRLNHLFVMGRVHKGEPRYGIFEGGELLAAATVSYLYGEAPDAFRQLQKEVWAELGAEARSRYDDYAAVWNGFLPSIPHAHLNMIGTLDRARGQGLGRLLMDRVHKLSVDTEGSEGVSLSTENPANVPLYEHVGYKVIAHRRVSEQLETWGMFRPDTIAES